MSTTKPTRERTEATAKLIEAELGRLGWLCTHDSPCAYTTAVEDDLPAGWVRVYDDSTSHYGDATETLDALRELADDAEYGETLTGDKPTGTRDWPADLHTTEQLEEGSVNDEPNTLITVETNAGTRYAAGPHGVYTCALSEAFKYGGLSETREAAIESGCEFETSDAD